MKGVGNELDRETSNKIDPEPKLNIFQGNLLPFDNIGLIFIQVRSVEIY
jgi:hypothetical protein